MKRRRSDEHNDLDDPCLSGSGVFPLMFSVSDALAGWLASWLVGGDESCGLDRWYQTRAQFLQCLLSFDVLLWLEFAFVCMQ